MVYKIKRFFSWKAIEEQREYTRAEKQAFLELYKTTGGLKHLPKALKPSNTNQFNQFAVDLKKMSLGNAKTFNRENAKTLFQNAGMPKMAGQIDKMIDKYTNKRALVRLARLKNRKGNEVDYNLIEKPYKKLSKILNKSADNHDEAVARYDKLHENRSAIPNKRVIRKLDKFAKDNNINVLRVDSSPTSGSRYGSSIETRPNGEFVRGSDGKDYSAEIFLNKKASEGGYSHELGHYLTYKLSPVGAEMRNLKNSGTPQIFHRDTRGRTFLDDRNEAFQVMSNHVFNIANENSANNYGKALLKTLDEGLSENSEAQANAAMQAYITNGANSSANKYRTSLKWM